MGIKKTIRILTVLFLILLSVSTVQSKELLLGVYTSDKPTVMYQKFTPITGYLQDYFAAEALPVTVNIKIYPTYQGAIDALVNGEVDFARFGPASYILAHSQNSDVRLLCMEHKKGKTKFNGVIIVRKDNTAINSIHDLSGKSFAFGDKNSTIGRYLSQAELVKNNIHSGDLKNYKYLDRHDKVALAVAAGNYDAGAVKENTFHKYEKTKMLKAINTFPNITKPWVVRAGLEQDIFEVLQKAMFELKDKKVLKSLKQDGFLPATDQDYDFVRKGMSISKDF